MHAKYSPSIINKGNSGNKHHILRNLPPVDAMNIVYLVCSACDATAWANDSIAQGLGIFEVKKYGFLKMAIELIYFGIEIDILDKLNIAQPT